METWLAEGNKTYICVWFFLRFQLICLQNYQIHFSISVSADNFLYVEN